MVKELLLPDGTGLPLFAPDGLTCPFFPKSDEDRERLCPQFRCAEKMHMIGHDHVAANRPAVTFACGEPLVDQYLCHFLTRENCFPLEGACCDEVDRVLDPNSLKPFEMLVHA